MPNNMLNADLYNKFLNENIFSLYVILWKCKYFGRITINATLRSFSLEDKDLHSDLYAFLKICFNIEKKIKCNSYLLSIDLV